VTGAFYGCDAEPIAVLAMRKQHADKPPLAIDLRERDSRGLRETKLLVCHTPGARLGLRHEKRLDLELQACRLPLQMGMLS
jgi:hypothetical protein